MFNKRDVRTGVVYLALIAAWWGTRPLMDHYHFGAWRDSLPLPYQELVGIAAILLFIVGPFAAFLLILKMRQR
jgi:hypothetical protein